MGESNSQDNIDQINSNLSNWNTAEAAKPKVTQYEINEMTDRLAGFYDLREQAYVQSFNDTRERLLTNPTATEEELGMGMLIESLEPQVRQAVLSMWRKGYLTTSSGFAGINHDIQSIDGEFVLDQATKEKLRALEVTVEDGDQGTTSISFRPLEPDLDSMSRAWDGIVGVLPDLGHPPTKVSSFTPEGVFEFRRMSNEGRLQNEYLDLWLHKTGNLILHPLLRTVVEQQKVDH